MSDDDMMLPGPYWNISPEDITRRLKKIAEHLKAATDAAHSLGYHVGMAANGARFDVGDIRNAITEVYSDHDISWAPHSKEQSIDQLTKFIASQVSWGVWDSAK